ncbi:hypothetical protein TNCV_4104651 [Trichonephila clavipes]|nr:hypothetical protein TNCV_4104651 [Trichonephila clavipes]
MLPETVRQVGLIYDMWRHPLSPPPPFRHGTGGEGTPTPCTHGFSCNHPQDFQTPDLTSMHSVCTLRVFGEAIDVEHEAILTKNQGHIFGFFLIAVACSITLTIGWQLNQFLYPTQQTSAP